MVRLLLIGFLTLAGPVLLAQKYVSEKSEIVFFSDAPMEDIKATNKKASSIFNSSNNEIVFSVPIAEFQFAKSLMQEHFNEKYMESDKYPKSTFQGTIQNFDVTKKETQNARAVGKLTIHGVTNDVDLPGTIESDGNNLIMKSKFMVKLADYKIQIPQLLWRNIAEQVEVTVEFTFKPQ
jgi:polyisoprenoid-binding protein YceI